MKKQISLVLSIVALASTAFLNACSRGGRDVSQEIVRPLDNGEVILEFKGGKISAGDVNEKMKPRLEQAREALLKEYVHAAEQVLAERKQNPKAKPVEVSDFEVSAYIKANHIPEAEKKQIQGFLVAEKTRLAKEDEKRNLFESIGVKNKLGSAQFDVPETKDAPQLGKSNAKVTIELFCDFANPLCNQARVAMQSSNTKFGDKIRWVYRFFPVASNPGSFMAASLAMCAQEQDLFWPAHDRLLDNGPAVAAQSFDKIIASIPSLDVKKLKTCMQSQDVKKKIDAEVAKGMNLGITSTPVYFIGNSKVEDADQISAAIQTRLAR